MVRVLSLALLRRPAIESLRIIGKVNLSSLHASYTYKVKHLNLSKSLGKIDCK